MRKCTLKRKEKNSKYVELDKIERKNNVMAVIFLKKMFTLLNFCLEVLFSIILSLKNVFIQFYLQMKSVSIQYKAHHIT